MAAAIRWTLVVTAWLATAGCGEDSAPEVQEEVAVDRAAVREQGESSDVLSEAQMTPAMMQRYRATCPMMVEGVEVTTADTDEGIALTFTAEDDVDALRVRVAHLAEMYTHHRVQGPMTWGHMREMHAMPGHGPGTDMHGRGMGMHGRMGMMPAATATYEEVRRGGRVVFTPTDPSDLDDLRQAVTFHQSRMASGQCWIVSGASDEGGVD